MSSYLRPKNMTPEQSAKFDADIKKTDANFYGRPMSQQVIGPKGLMPANAPLPVIKPAPAPKVPIPNAIPRPAMPSMPQRPPVGTPNAIPRSITAQPVKPGAKPITPTSPNVDYIPRPATGIKNPRDNGVPLGPTDAPIGFVPTQGVKPIAQQKPVKPGAKPITPTSPNVDYIPRPAMPSMPQRPTVGTPNAIPRPAIPMRTPVGTPNTIPKGAMGRMAKGGKVSSVSKRADGCAVRGKTKGRMV